MSPEAFANRPLEHQGRKMDPLSCVWHDPFCGFGPSQIHGGNGKCALWQRLLWASAGPKSLGPHLRKIARAEGQGILLCLS